MATATITIKNVTPKKTGETNGKAWTLYEVNAGNRQFSTLDPAWQLFVGDTLSVEYEVQKNGRYTNYRLGEAPAKPSAQDPAAALVSTPRRGTPPDRFSVLDGKLDRVLAELVAIRKHFAS